MNPAQYINAALRHVPAWPLYIAAILPPAWLLWQGLTGGLGVEPVRELEQELGKLGLQVLIGGLAITPLRRFGGVSLVRFRRAIGLIGFSYILLHLLVWLVLDVQIPAQIWADIVKRPYVTIGMAAFVLLVPLAVTSNALSLRTLGVVAWRRLHRLAYVAVLLGGVHYVMLGKVWQPEALIYLALIAMLLAARLGPRRGGTALRRPG